MTREAVVKALRAQEAHLKAQGILHLYLFGSVVRGDADDQSDVDLFYDYDPGRFGFLQFMAIRDLAPMIIGRNVDIMPRDGIHPLIRGEAERTAVEVF